jgi:hypothetical protein
VPNSLNKKLKNFRLWLFLAFLLLPGKESARHDVKDSAGTGVAGATVGSVLDS